MRVTRISGTICFLLLALSTCCDSSAQTFRRRSESPSVRLSYNDLTGIVERTRELIKTSNASFSASYESPHEYLDIDDGQAQVEITHDFSPASLGSAPEVAYSVRYQYKYANAPVSSVEFTLADYSRSVAVEGQSRTDVDAISNLILSDLNKYSVSFSGPGFRTGGSLALMVFSYCLIFFGVLAPLSKRGRIVLIGLALCIWVAFYSVPWTEWLPGTAVYSGDASWFKRNSPVLTFIGALLPVFTSISGVLFWLLKQIRSTAQPNDESDIQNAPPAHLM
jgi:hypothetical protein